MKVSWARKLGIAILHFVVAAPAVPIGTALLYYTFKTDTAVKFKGLYSRHLLG